jgi:transcription elongation factor Elf1
MDKPINGMTLRQRLQVAAHIERTRGDLNCRVCGRESLGVWGSVMVMAHQFHELAPGQDRELDIGHPMALVVCQHCGNSEHISLIVAGLLEPDT